MNQARTSKMEAYIIELKNSPELRSKMLMTFKRGCFYTKTNSYTSMTDSEGEDEDDVYLNSYVKTDKTDILWGGWDPIYTVVSVITQTFIGRNPPTDKKKFLAVYNEQSGEYFEIPGKIAKAEMLI
jgi:hypothetical protein